MNHSIYSADRMTHLKVVTVALVAGIAIASFSIMARVNSGDGYQTARITTPVVKATKDIVVTTNGNVMVR